MVGGVTIASGHRIVSILAESFENYEIAQDISKLFETSRSNLAEEAAVIWARVTAGGAPMSRT